MAACVLVGLIVALIALWAIFVALFSARKDL